MKKYRIYLKLCRQQAGLIAAGVALLLLEAVLAVRMPFLMNHVLDELFVISAENVQTFARSFLLYVVLFLLQILTGYASSVIFKLLGVRNSRIISKELMNKVFFAVKEEPAQFSAGNAMQIMGSDAFNIGEKGIIIIYEILHTIINLAALFYYMWNTLALLALLITAEFLVVMISFRKNMTVRRMRFLKTTCHLKKQGVHAQDCICAIQNPE